MAGGSYPFAMCFCLYCNMDLHNEDQPSDKYKQTAKFHCIFCSTCAHIKTTYSKSRNIILTWQTPGNGLLKSVFYIAPHSI